MQRLTINDLTRYKQQGQRFACLTAYDASMAALMERAGITCLLVGDSLGMVIQGQETTLAVNLDDICYHLHWVTRATQRVFIMADMPFGSNATNEHCYHNACRLLSAGAQMVKIEATPAAFDQFEFLATHGITVCAHLGLLPQSVNKLGGYRMQGKQADDYQAILQQAQSLAQVGCDMLLLECVPAQLAREIQQSVHIPVMGIGAGPYCDAQVLVSYDMLGITPYGSPAFSKNFLTDQADIEKAFSAYNNAVQKGSFPTL